MRYIYVLLVLGFLLSGCYMAKEMLEKAIESVNVSDTPLAPLFRGNFTWWKFVASVVSLAAGTYLVTRKIRLLLVTGFSKLNGKSDKSV